MKRLNIRLLSSGLTAIGLGLGATVSAQEASDPPASSDSKLETIVVTAQKREENVQDVPIAISAFAGESLAERQISDVSAIGNITPNVNLDAGTPFSGSPAVLGAFIRGIGQNDFAVNVDPGVGVYVDGVYLARTVGANFDLPDVERVEILKGPQGTLFGRNTIGGAINVVTRDPQDEFGVHGDATLGRFERLDADATIDVPLTDTLKSMVTVGVRTRDGYARRIPYTQAAPFATDSYTSFNEVGYHTADREGDEDMRTARVKFKWDTSSATVRLGADYTRVDQSAVPTAVLGVRAGPNSLAGLYNFCIGTPTDIIGFAGLEAVCGAGGTPLNPGSRQPPLAGLNFDGDPSNDRLPFDDRWVTTDIDKSHATGNSFSELENWGVSGTVDVDLTSSLTLRSITGYRDLDFSAGIDADNSPLAILHISNSVQQHQFSQEMQLIGNLPDSRVNYVVGAYYFDETADEDGIANIASTAGLQVDGPVHVKTENYAFFGQIDWRISDLVGVTVGGRYTNEDKRFEAAQTDLNGFLYKVSNCLTFGEPCTSLLGFPDPSDPLRFYPPGIQHKKFDDFSPKAGVQLHPTDDLMVYASYSVGYKSGGWSTRLESPFPTAPDFDEETATTWEAGVKSQLFDQRLQANLAVFTTAYEDMQLLFQRGASPIIENAGEARIRGFELEIVAALADPFRISASAGHLDAELTSVLAPAVSPPNPDQAGLDRGAPLPKVPRWKFNVSPRLELPVGNGGNIVLLADYSYLTSMWNDAQRTYLLKRPATDILSASFTYNEPNERWNISVGGTNLTGDRYVVNGLGQLAGGVIYGSYNRPREWYAKFGFNF